MTYIRIRELLAERPVLAIAAGVGLLAGCTPAEERQLERAGDEARQDAAEAGQAIEKAAEKAGHALKEAARDVKEEAHETRRELETGDRVIDRDGRDADRAVADRDRPADPADERNRAGGTAGERVAEGFERAGEQLGVAVDRAGEAMGEASIVAKIQGKYALDDLVKATRIDVDFEAGLVTLSGRVMSEEARQRAERLARETSGVRTVDNRLTIER